MIGGVAASVRAQGLAVCALGALLGVSLAACDRDEAPSNEAASATATATTEAEPQPPAHVGVLKGIVRLADGAEVPSFTREELGRSQRDAVGFPSGCTPHTAEDDEPVHLAADRGLGGILVSVTGDPDTFFRDLPEHQPQERRVVVDDCRLSPKLVVGLRGDTLVVQNSTQTNFFPLVGQASFAESLVFGESRSTPLERAGLSTITCPVLPHCGRADLVVIMNPVFTLTGEDGRFELRNVPAGQDVVVHAWHPLFREARVDTKVDENGERTLELVIEPLPREAAAGTTPSTTTTPAATATPAPAAP
jgi:hypothetical protein